MDYVAYTDDGYGHMEGVELISVGMDWPAMTGDYTVTFEQLADIVTAATEDPLVLDPRIKLGHLSEINGEMAVVNPFEDIGDAAPAFGRIVNLRVDGAVLLGDFVEVPVWLAEAMPSAYPNRSAEPWLAHTTPGGKQYAAILTAVSLLGAFLPAIRDLEDLERLMDAGPEAVAAIHREEPHMPPTAPALSVDAGTIADRFNFDWCLDPDSIFEDGETTIDPYWWWARSVRVDPLEIIAEGDGSDLWRIPVTTDGEDDVTYGTPERVREVFVPVNASAGDRSLMRTAPVLDGQRVLASNLDRPEKPARPAAAGPSNDPDPQETTVDDAETRELLGLAEDATDEQVQARQAQIAELEAPGTEPDDTDPEANPDGEPETNPAAVEETEPVAASTSVTVPAEEWADVNRRATAGATARDEQVAAANTADLDAAVNQGRIAPSRRDHYAAMQRTDPEGARTLLTATVEEGGLAPGLVPVSERGGADVEDDVSSHERIMAGAFGITTTEREGR